MDQLIFVTPYIISSYERGRMKIKRHDKKRFLNFCHGNSNMGKISYRFRLVFPPGNSASHACLNHPSNDSKLEYRMFEKSRDTKS